MTVSKTARRARVTKPVTQAPRQKRAARREAAATPSADETPPADQTAPDPARETTPPAPKGPAGKLGIIVDLMRRPQGATVTQMGEATGWLPHSVRGAMAGSAEAQAQADHRW